MTDVRSHLFSSPSFSHPSFVLSLTSAILLLSPLLRILAPLHTLSPFLLLTFFSPLLSLLPSPSHISSTTTPPLVILLSSHSLKSPIFPSSPPFSSPSLHPSLPLSPLPSPPPPPLPFHFTLLLYCCGCCPSVRVLSCDPRPLTNGVSRRPTGGLG